MRVFLSIVNIYNCLKGVLSIRILEELFYGNIQPNGNIQTDEYYQKQMAILSENETKLFSLLEKKEKELFFDYANAWGMVNATDTLENYIAGFKLGAKIVLETFDGSETYIKE